ncbi:iron-sulfur cluster co-chaperone protein HscB [Eupeodes corollae]|uniref:iron-sulfur cluster co-chaperone protein HscB n=1 Tax=Eupeodes corollae TaxID=290404 RepID=UPI002490BB51|nr:iron-sulfur cluster co-chaperone protein HscB [Eupeodes corollae]
MSVVCRWLGSIIKTKHIIFLTNVHLNNVFIRKPNIISFSTKPLLPNSQHLRFLSNSQYEEDCWNCKAKTKRVNNFMCDECGKLQDITKIHDFFELLSLPRDFDVPSTKLTKTFRQLQTLVHPDKFGNKSEREQTNAAEWSALINKAYKTLLNPLFRGQYLLKLQGEQMPQDNSTLNKEFLMEMMERNEEVDDAETKEDLNQINKNIQEELNGEINHLKELFKSNDLNGAKALLVKIKYLLSIQNSIQVKLEKLNG